MNTQQDVPPQKQIVQMLTGYWVSQSVSVAAKLGLADLVKDGPKSAEQLAVATNTQPQALYRLMRALASVGVFAEDDKNRFGLTPKANCLRSDIQGSQRSLAIMMGDEQSRAWCDLLYSIQTGKPAFDRVYGKPIFEHLADHPDQARLFDDAMTGVHGAETAAMIDAYDFSSLGTLTDIGGGNGNVLSVVLDRHPNLRGVLFDLDHVIERARGNLRARGLQSRCSLVAGNFFEAVPAGADAYMMRHIIHDWDDEQSLTILRNIRKVCSTNTLLLVIESVIPRGNDSGFGKLLDLNMLVIPGGMERTEEEYRVLYHKAGFTLTRIIPTHSEVSIIEGKPIAG